ncbi:MAG TPA: YceI family protein [Pyrinomonadaceae bacterium]|nr:YceI family protein [Pyrinomonadaceae bacterium]
MSGNETAAVSYRIDASRSRFLVRAEASGLLSVFGHNPTIAVRGLGGDVRFVPGTLASASLLVLVKADSLAVVGDVSEKDRREIDRAMREEVLEAVRYPEIVYMSRSVSANRTAENQYRITINGDLSLHGVTRNRPINAQITVNDQSLLARGEFALRQTDYNIKPVSAVGGTIRVKDELKLSFDISAERAEARD